MYCSMQPGSMWHDVVGAERVLCPEGPNSVHDIDTCVDETIASHVTLTSGLAHMTSDSIRYWSRYVYALFV